MKIDYSQALELNEKVIDYIFFSNENIEKSEDASASFERMSKYNLIRAEAFICGENNDYESIQEANTVISEDIAVT